MSQCILIPCDTFFDFFLPDFLVDSKKNSIFVPTKVKDIDGILRPTMSFVGQTEGKGVYERYHSVHSNFAHLKPVTEVMQR